jgi:hypothetical protein
MVKIKTGKCIGKDRLTRLGVGVLNSLSGQFFNLSEFLNEQILLGKSSFYRFEIKKMEIT